MTRFMAKILLSSLMVMIFLWPGLMAQEQKLIGPASTLISFESDKQTLPCRWRRKKTHAIINPLQDAEKIRSIQVLSAALSKYPKDILENDLQKVFVFRSMSFHHLEYGGTYHKRKVYLTNDGKENGYTDDYIEGTFHHEFSSILLNRHGGSFDKKAWMDARPEAFKYGKGGRAALQTSNTSLELDSSLHKSGFLNQYSLASFEEDFNCYVEFLFVSDTKFWDSWEKHEPIRKKTELIIEFYHSLNEMYTLEYFRNLQLKH